MKGVNASSEWATTFGFCPPTDVSMRIAKMITPTRLREIYAEELRKLGENNRADRVLDGSDTSAVSLAAVKALHRVADEAPQVVVFEALKNRLDEIRNRPPAEQP
jgi:hypothetical protein